MAHAYTPGLKVTERTTIRKKRLLPIPGRVLVTVGEQVSSSTPVATTDIPGGVHTVNVVNRLGIAPEEIRSYMRKEEGEEVREGEVLAENKPLIRWFTTRVSSPVSGRVESISTVTGQVLLREHSRPLVLSAYIDGEVVETLPGYGAVIETRAVFIQGIFGIGGEAAGDIAMGVKSPHHALTPESLTQERRGQIVIGGSHMTWEGLIRAREVGVRGMVVGGIHDLDLKRFLGYDMGVAVTGTEDIGFTLILTEGFGALPMARRTFEILVAHEGEKASISGATQIRAGVVRPEIIIPVRYAPGEGEGETVGRGGLQTGDPVRVIREPYFGRIGRVSALPSDLMTIPTESVVRVLEVEFPAGERVTIPRANVEIIEE